MAESSDMASRVTHEHVVKRCWARADSEFYFMIVVVIGPGFRDHHGVRFEYDFKKITVFICSTLTIIFFLVWINMPKINIMHAEYYDVSSNQSPAHAQSYTGLFHRYALVM